jgi:hypothetical protein
MHLTQKYGHIDVDDNSIAIMEAAIPQTRPTVYASQLESHITYDEILVAVRAGAHNKAPRIDGIGLEFYIENWDIIKSDLKDLLNQMFIHNQVSNQQKHAILVCLPSLKATQRQTASAPFSRSPLSTKSLPASRHGVCAR